MAADAGGIYEAVFDMSVGQHNGHPRRIYEIGLRSAQLIVIPNGPGEAGGYSRRVRKLLPRLVWNRSTCENPVMKGRPKPVWDVFCDDMKCLQSENYFNGSR